MARPVITDPLSLESGQRGIVSPTARPLDTFVETRADTSGTDALLRALDRIQSTTAPILKKQIDDQREEDFAEGEEAFRRNRTAFREAVRDGTIPAGASPHVRLGYRSAQLHTLGANYATGLARALEESDLHKVDDPSQVEEFIGAYYNDFLKDNALEGYDVEELDENFAPLAVQAHDAFRIRQANKNVEFIETERFKAFEMEVMGVLDMQDFDGNTASFKGAVAVTSDFLAAKAQELDQEGHDRTKISETIIDIVATEAVARKDPDLLNILENTQLGTAPLGKTRTGREAISAARERIASIRANDAARAHAAWRRQRAKQVEALDIRATQLIMNNPGSPEAMEAIEQLSKMDGGKARALLSFNNSAFDRADKNRRQEREAGNFADVMTLVLAAEDEEEALQTIEDAITSQRLNLSEKMTVWNQWKSNRPEEPTPATDALKDRLWTGAIQDLESVIAGGDDWQPALRDKAAQMRIEYEEAVMDWVQQHAGEDGEYDKVRAFEFRQKLIKDLREAYVPEDVRSENSDFFKARQPAPMRPNTANLISTAPPTPEPTQTGAQVLSQPSTTAADIKAFLEQGGPIPNTDDIPD